MLNAAVPPSTERRTYSPVYVPKNLIHQLPPDLLALVITALHIAGEFDFDLIRIAPDDSFVCLLRCPTLESDDEPKLKYCIKVFVASKQYCISDYTHAPSPPTLSRKDIQKIA